LFAKRVFLRFQSIGHRFFATSKVFVAFGVSLAAPVTHQDEGCSMRTVRIEHPFRRLANQKTVSAM